MKEKNKYFSNCSVVLVGMLILFSCMGKELKFDYKRNYLNITEEFSDTLFYWGDLEKDVVVSISLHVKGIVEGESELLLYQRPYRNSGAAHKILLKGDIDDCFYFNDWYDEKILIKYLPVDNITTGDITISYSFKTINQR